MGEQPQLMTKGEFAAHLGLKPSAISNYFARGRLTRAVMVGGKIDVAMAQRQLAASRDIDRPGPPGTPQPMLDLVMDGAAPEYTPTQVILKSEMLAEDLRRKRRENDEDEGRLVQVDEIHSAAMTAGRKVRDMLLSLAPRLAGEIAACGGDEVKIQALLKRRLGEELEKTARAIDEACTPTDAQPTSGPLPPD